MRRHGSSELTGLVVAGLVAFFAVLGFLPGSLAIGPAVQPALNNPETLVLTASDASYLSPVTLAEVSGARIEEKQTLTPDDSAGSSSVAVWAVTTSDKDTAHNQQLEPTSRAFAVDRATEQLVSCCGANIDGNQLIRQSGLSGYIFPGGTRRQAYDIYNTVLGRPGPRTPALARSMASRLTSTPKTSPRRGRASLRCLRPTRNCTRRATPTGWTRRPAQSSRSPRTRTSTSPAPPPGRPPPPRPPPRGCSTPTSPLRPPPSSNWRPRTAASAAKSRWHATCTWPASSWRSRAP